MLGDLPAELLLNILGFLDNLDPVSASNRTLSATVRDHRASQLSGRLARVRQADLLMQIWSPPTFFLRNSRGQRYAHRISHPQEMFNVLCDPQILPRVESYIASLERKAWVARRVAEHLIGLLQFSGFRSSEERLAFASRIVIYMWSAQQRWAHDPDGYIQTLHGDITIEDICATDQYLIDMPADQRAWVVACYNALSQYLRPPFVPQGRRGEGMWLYRLIVRDGMESVHTMLEQRGHR
ncbi:hypothetical protein EDC01DRAFT_469709 [Geopyxis carbonaria]|nr:hypothetical protein EDC01DRAFT_469709 [Geopyxis carbonaria]